MTYKPYHSAIATMLLLSVFASGQTLTVERALGTLKTHEFGQHTDALDFLRDAAARAQTDPAIRHELNTGFTEVLQSNASYAAKQFVCRLLVFTATEKQIPALGSHLSDPEMSHMALSVLAHLHDPAVDQTLITALETTSGNAQLGIITTLGNRRSVGAVTSLASLLDSDQPGVAAEAALALGRIGTQESARVLNKFVSQYQGALPGKVTDAMLVCADNLAAKEPAIAGTMYQQMLDRRHPSATRCAALNGLAHLPGPQSLASVLTALNGEDIQLRQTAAQLARTLPDPDIAITLARQLNTLASDTQVLVTKALASRGDRATLEGIRTAAAHASVGVRIAALNALASLGDESVIRLLADRVVQGVPIEQAAAKNALATLAGDRINGQMVTQLKQAPPAQQIVLIEALTKRQALEAAPALLVLTQSDTPAVRTASLTALGELGSRDQIAELAERLIHNDSLRDLTGQALVQIALRTGRSEDASQSLLEGLKTAKTRPLRTTLLSTLGQLKHDSALDVLSAALEDTDEIIRYNAIKALSAWPNASPAPSLLTVAQTSSNSTHRILAVRGYINLVSLSTLPAGQKIEHYQRAMALASVAEKKSVLAKLPDLQNAQALRMASQHLTDPATVNEAAQATTTLAQALLAQDPGTASDAVLRVIESTVADSFKQKAQQILEQLSTIEGNRVTANYQALARRPLSQGSTWTIADRDGANRSVTAYLSSLGQGEAGTGTITSNEFVLGGRAITFTLCGHDGQGGGRHENFIALVDAATHRILKKTEAPNHDAMQPFTWDISELKGTKARIEVHDGISGSAYAWFGVGEIDASPAFKINFSQGMPRGWASPEQKMSPQVDLITEGVPFRQDADRSNLIPAQGSIELPCGFAANRLFFLGATVDAGRTGACYGGIEIHYQTGSPDVIPLIYGDTLTDPQNEPKATHLHATTPLHQFYLAITPQPLVIEKIRLVADPKQGPIPLITAVTCETTAAHGRLVPLTKQSISQQETNWIDAHSIDSASPRLNATMRSLHARFNVPGLGADSAVKFKKLQIDSVFRSEGVAVADFNGDGQLDIAAGHVYYADPHWTMTPMVNAPVEFNRYGYSNAFLCFAADVDHDSDMDLIVVGFPGQQTHWLENPGQPGTLWAKHLAVSETGNESPMYVDVNGDGRKELLFFNQGHCVMGRPGQNPRAPWGMETLSGPGDPAPGHGLGVGDLNGDGRVDVLIPDGWWEAPSGTTPSPWPFHKAELFGGVQMCVFDFDADGDADVLGSSAHGYGIAWTEQTPDGWKTHEIDHTDSQTHAIHLADINGDGLMDFVTGKRFWAHNGHDTGSFQPAVLCWYEQQRQNGRPQWVKRILDFDSGVGLHFQIVDITGDGRLDIVTSNKKGVHIFEQLSP